MTVLVDWQIAEAVRSGEIIIDPYEPRQVNSGSVDIRLGEFFFKETKPNTGEEVYVNAWCKKNVQDMWGEPIRAPLATHKLTEALMKSTELGPDDRIIILKPHQTILGHTQEFIGGKSSVITHMQARSSIGRVAIEICKCAGWGDHGYFNRWTMEITNNAEYHRIILVVGRRVGQIVFLQTEQPSNDVYSKSGKYQKSSDLQTLKDTWSPYQMLPRLDLDWDLIKEVPIPS